MSVRKVLLPCPGCEAHVACDLASRIDAVAEPALAQALLSGELMRLTCARCGWDTTFDAPLEYVDTRLGLHVRLVTDDAAESDARAAASSLLRRRIVRSRAELVEKVVLAEAGLDDRLVEAAKASLRRDVPEYAEATLLFEALDEGGLLFVRWLDDGTEPVRIGRASFDALADELALPPEAPGFSRIDASWGERSLPR